MHEDSLRATGLTAYSFVNEASDWGDTSHLLLATTPSGCASFSPGRMMHTDVVKKVKLPDVFYFVSFPCSQQSGHISIPFTPERYCSLARLCRYVCVERTNLHKSFTASSHSHPSVVWHLLYWELMLGAV